MSSLRHSFKKGAVLGNSSLTEFDVLVVGSGAGGASIADVLTRNGLKVLILEAGANYFPGLDDPAPGNPVPLFSNDEVKMLHRGLIMPGERVEPRTFRREIADGVRTFTGDVNHLPKTVGGGAVHADLKTPRFMPQDFQLGRHYSGVANASFADWPVDYDALEPFYGYVERVMGVQGRDGLSPFDPPRSSPYPMEPGAPMLAGLVTSQAAAALGYHPFPYPSAITSRPYDGREACADCGFCGLYGCPINAKGSPAVTALRRALLTGRAQLRTETRVVRIHAPTGREVTRLSALGPEGETLEFRADRYVLAASPIESARLLLLSDPSGVHSGNYAGLGNSSGMVGRNLMFHYQTIVAGVFARRLHGHRGRTVTHGMSDFRGIAGDKSKPLGGIVEFSGITDPIREAKVYATMIGLRGSLLKQFIRESPLRDRLLVLTMQAEDAPQGRNRVDLDPEVVDLDGLPVARVTYQNHPFELSASEHYTPKLMDLVGKAGAKYGFIAPPDAVPSSRHILGTLRFGSDPEMSVCDRTGRMHDVGNLFVADGSLFPTSSGFNPTLTIAALAARVGGEMVYPGSPERAIE